MNKIEREVAGKDLVNSYGVVEWFIRNLFICKQFYYINQESYGFKSSTCNFQLGWELTEGTVLVYAHKILVQVSLYSNVIQSKEVSNFTTLELFELDYKYPTILFQNDNS